MVWESGCVVIVMLTPLSENGVRQCYHYWPDEGSNLYHVYEVLPRVAAVGRGLGGRGLWRALAGLPCVVADRCPLKSCCAVGSHRRCSPGPWSTDTKSLQTPMPRGLWQKWFSFFKFYEYRFGQKGPKNDLTGWSVEPGSG